MTQREKYLLEYYRSLICRMIKEGKYPYHCAELPEDIVIDRILWSESQEKEEENLC